mmetsp:Transcript_12031/g.12094  ORF Transcript_12031/g.12094 Transcript_12031/m.12094 type:complete len:325 (+) Transcript_12031:102-1076(+)|eukprot:CAMPEP_0182429154 /NCGR_PEP_ID=MMETSP1167-20130531/25552_1 /TAXON_ID=2988 /ORGANISM="Mallomonas Sp, Strain CCMP3275" /LENGTH=324 /DNA_ID=CAMNT_0024612505 /DNA_START=56 /DNA_END=1030 /DNA_ORIENTATION=-
MENINQGMEQYEPSRPSQGEIVEESIDADVNLEISLSESEHSSILTPSEEGTSWISWFINLRGNEFFCEVDDEYIQDDFNLTGLSTMVPYYDYSLDMMLDVDIPLDTLSEEQQEIVETAAEVLYGLIHARFILTSRGMQRMHEKHQNVDFGRCPRVYCQGQPVLPIGLSDVPRHFAVNVYCPRCQDIFYPRSTKQANLDGAYFGTTFSHLFLLTHPDLIPQRVQQTYVPRIYGFRIHKDSLYYKQRETTGVSSRRTAVGNSVISTQTQAQSDPSSGKLPTHSSVNVSNAGKVDKNGEVEASLAVPLEASAATALPGSGVRDRIR